jgi:hypothetical protein
VAAVPRKNAVAIPPALAALSANSSLIRPNTGPWFV